MCVCARARAGVCVCVSVNLFVPPPKFHGDSVDFSGNLTVKLTSFIGSEFIRRTDFWKSFLLTKMFSFSIALSNSLISLSMLSPLILGSLITKTARPKFIIF